MSLCFVVAPLGQQRQPAPLQFLPPWTIELNFEYSPERWKLELAGPACQETLPDSVLQHTLSSLRAMRQTKQPRQRSSSVSFFTSRWKEAPCRRLALPLCIKKRESPTNKQMENGPLELSLAGNSGLLLVPRKSGQLPRPGRCNLVMVNEQQQSRLLAGPFACRYRA